MLLKTLRLANFQSFGPEPTEINLDKMNFLIGPNGSGKTVILQALCRLFAFSPALRRIQKTDFHVPRDGSQDSDEQTLFIEAHFLIPECLDETKEHSTIPPCFPHMRLYDDGGIPEIRFRLEASMGPNGDIEDNLLYILAVGEMVIQLRKSM